jgi:hypothetical protein
MGWFFDLPVEQAVTEAYKVNAIVLCGIDIDVVSQYMVYMVYMVYNRVYYCDTYIPECTGREGGYRGVQGK